jgi:hypothetical protein
VPAKEPIYRDPPPDPRADRWTSSIRDPVLREAVARAARGWLAAGARGQGRDHPDC